MKHITSRDNPAFKRLRSLAEDVRTRREERASLIDGEHLLDAALDARWPIRQIVVCEDVVTSSVFGRLLGRVGKAGEEVSVLVLTASLFKQISPVMTPTGILAEIAIPSDEEGCLSHETDVLALAGVQDAGNLGSLLRTAVAAGIGQVWLDRQTTQAWSPKALRAGMGAQFRLCISENCDLLARFAVASHPVLVTSLAEGCVSLFEADLKGPAIWVFGAEGQGVPAALQARANMLIRIPMSTDIESLNVGAAAAVCLFEQLRQRQR